MSEETLAFAISLAVVALLFLWVPFLNLVCPPCARALERRREQRETQVQTEAAAMTASRRRALN